MHQNGNHADREEPFLVLHPFMWEEFELQGTVLLVYARVFGFCKRGGSFYESRASTARYLGVSERSVIRAMNALEEKGLVEEVAGSWKRDGFMTRSYVLGRLPKVAPSFTSANLTPPDADDVPSVEPGDNSGNKGVPDWHLKSKEEIKD